MLLFNILQLVKPVLKYFNWYSWVWVSTSIFKTSIKNWIEMFWKKMCSCGDGGCCEIKMVSEETINVLPLSSVLYKPHNYIKYHINIFRGPINITTFIIKNYCQCYSLHNMALNWRNIFNFFFRILSDALYR